MAHGPHFRIGFLSTPSARRATDAASELQSRADISIHALREEGDKRGPVFYVIPPRISIHALREEGDVLCGAPHGCTALFLSTPSARRATAHIVGRLDVGAISIHALREEGDPAQDRHDVAFVLISIHALREEGDMGYGSCSHRSSNFYPRPPRGGRLSRIGIDEGTDQFLSTPSARRATAKTETKSLFSNKLYNILHEFRRALIYNGSKNDPNHAK